MSSNPVTAKVAHLFNVSYAMLVSILNCFFLHGGETAEEFKLLSSIAVDMMFNVTRPIGILLTTPPINLLEVMAGASFETYHLGKHSLPHDNHSRTAH